MGQAADGGDDRVLLLDAEERNRIGQAEMAAQRGGEARELRGPAGKDDAVQRPRESRAVLVGLVQLLERPLQQPAATDGRCPRDGRSARSGAPASGPRDRRAQANAVSIAAPAGEDRYRERLRANRERLHQLSTTQVEARESWGLAGSQCQGEFVK